MKELNKKVQHELPVRLDVKDVDLLATLWASCCSDPHSDLGGKHEQPLEASSVSFTPP